MEVPVTYCDWIRNELADISLLGLEPKEGKVATLRQVYVPALTQSPSRKNADDRRELVNLLARLDAESLYVPGSPGSGKTTFCKWLALLVTTGQVPEQGIILRARGRRKEDGPDLMFYTNPIRIVVE